MSQVIKHDFNDLSTPDTVGLKKIVNYGLISKLKKAVDNLNEKEYEMYHPCVHEVVAALLQIMNNGIDYSKMSTAMPISTDDNRGFMSANMSWIYNRRTTKYVHELKFLKTEKMRSQIWLLLELSNGSLSELFNQQNLAEIQSRYTAQSAIKLFHFDIRDSLESIELRNIKFTGQIIERYNKITIRFHKYLESTIDLPCTSDYDESNPKTCAPIHKKKNGMENLQTPDRFGSPTIIMDQFEFTLEPDTIEEKQITPSIQFKDLKKDKLKNSYRLFRSNYESYVENYYYQQYSQAPRIVSLEKQNYKCQDCQKSIQKGIPLLRQKTAQLCHYSGYWFCKQCIHPIQTIIPSKVFQNFDFNKYQVNIQGYQDIQGILKIPMFQINYCQNMIYDNHSLYDFLILRRELHLMYDRFCDPIVFQELSQLKRQMYFVIQIPLLSLDDLQGIKNGTLVKFVAERKKVLLEHVKLCFNCQKHGQICKGCESQEKIFCYDIKNTLYCKTCYKLFHRECFNRCCQ